MPPWGTIGGLAVSGRGTGGFGSAAIAASAAFGAAGAGFDSTGVGRAGTGFASAREGAVVPVGAFCAAGLTAEGSALVSGFPSVKAITRSPAAVWLIS